MQHGDIIGREAPGMKRREKRRRQPFVGVRFGFSRLNQWTTANALNSIHRIVSPQVIESSLLSMSWFCPKAHGSFLPNGGYPPWNLPYSVQYLDLCGGPLVSYRPIKQAATDIGSAAGPSFPSRACERIDVFV